MLPFKLPQSRSDPHPFSSLSVGENKPWGLPICKEIGKSSPTVGPGGRWGQVTAISATLARSYSQVTKSSHAGNTGDCGSDSSFHLLWVKQRLLSRTPVCIFVTWEHFNRPPSCSHQSTGQPHMTGPRAVWKYSCGPLSQKRHIASSEETVMLCLVFLVV